jgi:RNA polymerase sigma factor (sigma-70 family)
MTDTLRFRRTETGDTLGSAELLRECGQRLTDPVLWKHFQDRFQKTILTLVMRVMWNRFRNDCLDEACDLVQDIYLRMLDDNGRMLRSFRGDTDFSVRAFLARVVLNVVSDHYRSMEAEKRRPADIVSIEEARSQKKELPGEAVELDVVSILSWIDVERLMETEPDRHKAARNVLIFKLFYIDGFTIKEISQFPAFGLKESSIDEVLMNMRALLKKRMGR